MRNTHARRLELLKLEGQGFNKVEIVTQLSESFTCSRRAVYHDYETRDTWQPFTTKAAALKILNRYNQIYRHAALKRLTAEGDSNQIGWTRIMLDANKALADHFVLPSVLRMIEKFEERTQ